MLLPYSIFDAPAYQAMSRSAQALLLEFARQFNGANNGKLIATYPYLCGRGWRSKSEIQKAMRELEAAGFIYRTAQGGLHRPSWFAVTWQTILKCAGFDAGAFESFERAAYRTTNPTPATKRKPPMRQTETVGTRPDHRANVARLRGQNQPALRAGGIGIAPTIGPINAVFGNSPSPTDRRYLNICHSMSEAMGSTDQLERVDANAHAQQRRMQPFEDGTYRRLTAKPVGLFTNLIH